VQPISQKLIFESLFKATKQWEAEKCIFSILTQFPPSSRMCLLLPILLVNGRKDGCNANVGWGQTIQRKRKWISLSKLLRCVLIHGFREGEESDPLPGASITIPPKAGFPLSRIKKEQKDGKSSLLLVKIHSDQTLVFYYITHRTLPPSLCG
jgi:hypothetical protein